MATSRLVFAIGAALCLVAFIASPSDAIQDGQNPEINNQTTIRRRLTTYAGALLPADWLVVSIINERAVIGFNNGTARNSLIDDLDSGDRQFIRNLQNGTLVSTPLAGAREKITQWSSSVASTATKYGQALKDQFDNLLSNYKGNKTENEHMTSTIIVN